MITSDQRVLVFSAHAADFCSRAGGTIMKFIEAGATVHVPDMTYGERCESTALWARDPKPTIEEVKARRGRIIAVVSDDAPELRDKVEHIIRVPQTIPALLPVLTTLPLQLLAYHMAILRGADVDQPRNLAKSVTVE